MTKEEIIIALCDMIVRLTSDIEKGKERGDVNYGYIGIRKELLDIVTSSKEEDKSVIL